MIACGLNATVYEIKCNTGLVAVQFFLLFLYNSFCQVMHSRPMYEIVKMAAQKKQRQQNDKT